MARSGSIKPRLFTRRETLRAFGAAAGTVALAACAPSAAPSKAGSVQPSARLPDDVQAAVDYAKANLPAITPEVIAAAKQEGSVVLSSLNWGESQKKMEAAFLQHFPFLSVTGTQGSGSEQTARFTAEAAAGRGSSDVFQSSISAEVDAFVKKSQVLEYRIGEDDKFPEGTSKSGYWYSLHLNVPDLNYREGRLTDAELAKLRTWGGLADPVFKGRIGMPDIAAGGLTLGSYYALRTVFGESVWNGLAANKPRVYAGSGPGLDALLRGEVDIYIFTATGVQRWAAGEPIRFFEPNPKWWVTGPQFLPKLAPHPNAAKLYQEWTFSVEGMELWQKASGNQAARSGIKDTRPYVSEPWFRAATETFLLDPAKFGAEQSKMGTDFKRAFQTQ